MAVAFRFVAPAGTPVGLSDLAWWVRHGLTDRDAVERFGAELRARLGVRYTFLVSTGRAALTLALTALRNLDGRGRNEVVIPSYTCFSVASSVVKAGLKIRLADIDPKTLDFTPDALSRVDSDRVLAVVATNLYGLPNDLPAIATFAEERRLFVVDDAAQSLGASVAGRASGTWGDVGIYSFDKGKNITSIDGGVIVTSSDQVAAAIDALVRGLRPRTLGEAASHVAKLLAYSALLHPRRYWLPNALPSLKLGTTVYRTDYPLAQYDPWLAPIGRRLLGRLDAVTKRRVENADRLRRSLSWSSHLQSVDPVSRAIPVYLRFPVLIDPGRRDAVVAKLCARGIGATASYPTAIADIPELRGHWAGREPDVSGGRWVAERIVTLPTHPYVTPRDCECAEEVIVEALDAENPAGRVAAAWPHVNG